jgi:hypothetical protein
MIRSRLAFACLLVVAVNFPAPPTDAAQKKSHAYLLQVMTPDGKRGFLAMAEAEIQTALVEAALAAKKPEDLEYMKAQARAVQHAIDPSWQKTGPGHGFGVKKAAAGIASYATAAGKSPDASEKVRSYSRWIATSAKNVVARSDRISDLLGKVQRMKTSRNAFRVMRLVRRMCQEVLLGKDTNKDGKVSWKKHEGGLAQAKRYMRVVLKLEKLLK